MYMLTFIPIFHERNISFDNYVNTREKKTAPTKVIHAPLSSTIVNMSWTNEMFL